MWFAPPPEIRAAIFSEMPAALRLPVSNDWTRANFASGTVDCLLEGPCFDERGRLHLVDIPHGRLIAVDGDAWRIACAYDGLPNGMKSLGDGAFLIADHRRGLVRYDAGADTVTDVLPNLRSEGFKGLNDLTLHADGSVLFTDQGQTGLHDPTGRVFRVAPDGRVDRLIANAPSPNGLVLDSTQRHLFVAMTRSCQIWVFALKEGAEVTKAQCFCQLPGGRTGPDGLAMDRRDRLFVCDPGHGCVWVVAPDGRPVLRVVGPQGSVITNCAFAPDGRTLFMTSAFGAVLACEIPGAD